MSPGPSFDDVRAAAVRISAHVPPTPVLRSAAIDAWVGARVHLKAEHLHATGAFKLRGATNAVLQLSEDEAARGVVAHSSGNHASALARAASTRGIACTIVIPRGAPATKVAATMAEGGRIVECEPTMEARAEAVAKLVADSGAVEIHPFDDPDAPELTEEQTADAASVSVELDGTVHELSWPRSQTLVDIMMAAGLDVPYSCREGECGSCACTVVDGTVEMENVGALDQEDIDDGYILGCQARPTSDHLTIEF